MDLSEHISFNEWLLLEEIDKDFFKQVVFARNKFKLPTNELSKQQKINKEVLDTLFIQHFFDTSSDIPNFKKFPIIYYGGSSKNGKAFIENANVPSANFFNHPDETRKVSEKVTFHKIFEDVKFIPKTVFDKSDVGEISFPIIAKPSNGHSGIGIKKFNTKEELDNSSDSFDLFSTAVEFTNEFRVLLINDEIIQIDERIEKIGITDKKMNESLDFIYAELSLSKFPFIDKLASMAKTLHNTAKLGIWSMDVVLGKDKKFWVLEINSATGLGAIKLINVYIKIFETFYKKTLPQSFHDSMNDKFLIPSRKLLWKENKKLLNKSKWRISYEHIK